MLLYFGTTGAPKSTGHDITDVGTGPVGDDSHHDLAKGQVIHTRAAKPVNAKRDTDGERPRDRRWPPDRSELRN